MAAEADATATFALNLESNVPATAAEMAASLGMLKGQLQGDVVALREMQGALRNLKGGGVASQEAIKALTARIAAQKASIASAQGAYLRLGGTFAKGAKETAGADKGWRALLKVAASSGGHLGTFAGKLTAINASSIAVAAGSVAVVAGLLAVAAAAATVIGSLVAYGVAQADTRRSELLSLEGLTKIRYWWAGFPGVIGPAADKASFLQSTIDEVSQSVAIGRDKVAAYATELYKAGLRGGNLQAALEGVSTTAAVQGDQQAGFFKSWAVGAAYTGQSVRKLADDVKARLGGIAKQQMLSLDVQVRKLHENLSYLFSGVKINSILQAIATITELFSQTTESGRALKDIVEAIFPSLGVGAEATSPIVKRFFQGMVLMALDVTIALYEVRNWFKKTFGDSSLFAGWDGQRAAFEAGRVTLGLLAGVLVVSAVAAGLLAVALFAIGAGLLFSLGIIGGAIALIGFGLYTAFTLITAAGKWLLDGLLQIADRISEMGWSEVGSQIVKGIAAGITDGATWVLDAIKGVGMKAFKAFHSVFEIHSPSHLMRREARNIPRGQALGIRDGAGEVAAAINDTPGGSGNSIAAAEAPSAPAAGKGGSMVHIELGGIVVQAAGGQADDMSAAVMSAVRQALEGVAIALGARQVTFSG